jgi:hypothetical protein
MGSRAVTRTAKEYRRLARECLNAARATPLGEMRTTLIDAAQTWLRLAEEQEHAGANVNLPPAAPVEHRQVVQQQQQVQPKDEDENE